MRKSIFIAGLLLAAPSVYGAAQQVSAPINTPIHITVDLNRSEGAYKPIYGWFGYDEGNYTSTPTGRALLGEVHDLGPAPVYIRFHHLLTSGDGMPELKWSSTNVYSEDASGRPVYNFAIMDAMFDAMKSAGVRPMVELGFMPKDLAATLPDRPVYQVHYPESTTSGASNNPPKDYTKWQELVRVVTEHLVERYGRESVRQWYFEVWNEPDRGYWHGSPEEYWKLYDYAVAGVRAALPEAMVGGPATTGPVDPKAAEFLQNFLQHVERDKSAATGGAIPLDFISFHVKGKPTLQDGHVTMGISSELQSADKGFAIVASFPQFKKLPIILSEADPEGCAACSSKVNPANNYRNGTMYPAYTAAAYKGLFQLADKYGVNLISMLSWSFEYEGREYFEGFRDLSTNGIDKPILNFFRMAGKMDGERVRVQSTGAPTLNSMTQNGVAAEDVDALATRNGHHADVLLWNYKESDAPDAAADVHLHLQGLPRGAHVAVQLYAIDGSHSNAYTVWKTMGSPQRPTQEQIAKLKAAAGLERVGSLQLTAVRNEGVTFPLQMPVESLSLIELSW